MRNKLFKQSLFMVSLMVTNAVYAQDFFDPSKDLKGNLEAIYGIALKLIPYLVLLVGIWAGYLYITALGDEPKTQEAKKWIGAALAGLILLLLLPLILDALGIGTFSGGSGGTWGP